MTFTEDWYPRDQLHQLRRLVGEALTSAPGDFAEIGCWEGRSTVAIAAMLMPWGCQLHAVDTWAGNLDEGEDHPTVRILAQRDVHTRFLANVQPYAQVVEVFCMDGLTYLTKWAGSLAFCHLDAGHTYEATKTLIDAALPRMAPGGILCGDDYVNANAGRDDLHGGVERAVRECLDSRGVTIYGNLWAYRVPWVIQRAGE